ncbi:hypothetical protein E8E13_001745 [Curvularia kusanoi]|uniref:SprT-like domain-containing protein n=1 Tax=Curvularia kusanoi TaxID=90978 RepID=A0A9P4T3W6_CURKU|nr:hypothetical protein E8E13_001745 [Curvularia kusanoi]
MPITDEEAALQAIAALGNLTEEQQAALHAINAIISDGEPFVNVIELFGYYNKLYFRNLLVPRVEVIWSPRLTLCAGICELSKDPATNKFTRIRLKLSTPLLQYPTERTSGSAMARVSEPELTKKQLQNLSGKERAGRQKNKLDNWIASSRKKDGDAEGYMPRKPDAREKEDETVTDLSAGQKRSHPADDYVPVTAKKALVECPICTMRIADVEINDHLDAQHP